MEKLRELFWSNHLQLEFFCEESNIAPIWEMHSSELKVIWHLRNMSTGEISENNQYGDIRTVIYETKDNSMKIIQNAALFVLALNCGLIGFWFGQYKPIFADFQINHGAKNANGERNGRPRTRLSLFRFDIFIGLNRFIILVSFLSKILIPFVDSITG